MSARKSIDSRDHPDDTGRTLYLSSEDDEVIRAAASVHGMKDTPELREQFRSMLKDEAALSHRERHEWRWNGEHRTDSSPR